MRVNYGVFFVSSIRAPTNLLFLTGSGTVTYCEHKIDKYKKETTFIEN